MAILVSDETRLAVQGITGHQGRYHSGVMKGFGTRVVAGVTPGKGGQEVDGIPVFDTMTEAVAGTGANTSIIFVPAPFAKDAALEAIDAGIGLVVLITEHIPFHDALDIMPYAKLCGATVVGPNTPGVVSPGMASVSIMPVSIFKKGNIGVVSRSGTLTYEIVNTITEHGLGQSTCLGLGGDPVTGLNFTEALRLFEEDPQTESIVMVGEIGGTAEEEAAEYIREHLDTPVYAYIAGRTAPPGKRMGHAGAIITRGRGTAESKVSALTDAGVKVAKFPRDIPKLILGEE